MTKSFIHFHCPLAHGGYRRPIFPCRDSNKNTPRVVLRLRNVPRATDPDNDKKMDEDETLHKDSNDQNLQSWEDPSNSPQSPESPLQPTSNDWENPITLYTASTLKQRLSFAIGILGVAVGAFLCQKQLAAYAKTRSDTAGVHHASIAVSIAPILVGSDNAQDNDHHVPLQVTVVEEQQEEEKEERYEKTHMPEKKHVQNNKDGDTTESVPTNIDVGYNDEDRRQQPSSTSTKTISTPPAIPSSSNEQQQGKEEEDINGGATSNSSSSSIPRNYYNDMKYPIRTPEGERALEKIRKIQQRRQQLYDKAITRQEQRYEHDKLNDGLPHKSKNKDKFGGSVHGDNNNNGDGKHMVVPRHAIDIDSLRRELQEDEERGDDSKNRNHRHGDNVATLLKDTSLQALKERAKSANIAASAAAVSAHRAMDASVIAADAAQKAVHAARRAADAASECQQALDTKSIDLIESIYQRAKVAEDIATSASTESAMAAAKATIYEVDSRHQSVVAERAADASRPRGVIAKVKKLGSQIERNFKNVSHGIKNGGVVVREKGKDAWKYSVKIRNEVKENASKTREWMVEELQKSLKALENVKNAFKSQFARK